METERLLSMAEVAKICGLSKVTLWRMRKEGRFPAPLELGAKTLRWRESAVLAWIEGLPARENTEAATAA